MVMQSRATWAEDRLARELGTTTEVLRRKIGFWVKHGVLCERTGRAGGHTYTRAEQLATGEVGDRVMQVGMEEDEGESALVSQEEQLKQVLCS